MPSRLLLIAALAASLALAACGEESEESPGRTPLSQGKVAVTGTRVDPADERTIRNWSDALRRGDVTAAARYFKLPSLVSNGTPPVRLETRAQAEGFNRALSCGARLIATEAAAHGFVIATFELSERPGAGSCGTGVGETARTAFKVTDDLITDWLRLGDLPEGPSTLA
jgi:hypothetical protein